MPRSKGKCSRIAHDRLELLADRRKPPCGCRRRGRVGFFQFVWAVPETWTVIALASSAVIPRGAPEVAVGSGAGTAGALAAPPDGGTRVLVGTGSGLVPPAQAAAPTPRPATTTKAPANASIMPLRRDVAAEAVLRDSFSDCINTFQPVHDGQP